MNELFDKKTEKNPMKELKNIQNHEGKMHLLDIKQMLTNYKAENQTYLPRLSDFCFDEEHKMLVFLLNNKTVNI
jgi:RNA-binding protein YlmH